MKKIIFKSAPVEEQILARIKAGFRFLEIQLTETVVTDEMLHACMNSEIDVISVHTPLCSNLNFEDVNINEIDDDEIYSILWDTCVFAESLSEYYKHDISIVIHNSFSKRAWEIGNQKNIVYERMEKIVRNCPHVRFVIENVTPVAKEHISSLGLYLCDAAYIAEYLNQKFKRQIFGVVFDVCHYLIVSEIHNVLRESNYSTGRYTLEQAFQEAGKLCTHIHLNNKIGNGEGKNHGTPFTDSEKDTLLLKKVIDCINCYTKADNIVVEVSDEDYIEIPSVVETFTNLKKIMEKQNIFYEY